MRNYYEILGVRVDASPDEIRKRYLFLVKAYHPDRFSDPEAKKQAEEEMKILNEAYGVLSKPEKRAKYDQTIGVKENSQDNSSSEDEQDTQLHTLMDYLEGLSQKWHVLLDSFQPTKETDFYIQSLITEMIVFINPLKSRVSNFSSEEIIQEVQYSIVFLMRLSIALGAEIGINGAPKFSFWELFKVMSLPLMSQIFMLSELAKRNHVLPSEKIDQTIGNMMDSAMKLSQICIQIGIVRVQTVSTAQTRSSETPPTNTTTGVNAHEKTFVKDYCVSCHRHTPTVHLTFRQNIGIFVRRFYTRVEGSLCAECAELYFWRMSAITLWLGWWGVISLIMSPFYLIANLYNYLKSWSLRKYSPGLLSKQLGWKLAVLAAVILIILMVENYKVEQSSLASNFVEERKSVITIETQPTSETTFSYTRPATPTPSCLLWSDVSAEDEGKYLCVYGIVQNAYFSDDNKLFFITFTKDSVGFRFIVLGGYFYKEIIGNCVSASGVVKTYGKMPYIDVTDALYQCK